MSGQYSEEEQFKLIGDKSNPRGSFKGTPEESFQKYLDDTEVLRAIQRKHDIWKPEERDRYYSGEKAPIDYVDSGGIPRHYWWNSRMPLRFRDKGYGRNPHKNPHSEDYLRWNWEKAGSPYVAMYPNDLLRYSQDGGGDRDWNRAFFTRGKKHFLGGKYFRGGRYSDDVADTVHVSSKLFPTLDGEYPNKRSLNFRQQGFPYDELPVNLQSDYEAEEAHGLQTRDTEPAVRDSLFNEHAHQYGSDVAYSHNTFLDWLLRRNPHIEDSADRYKDIHKFEGQAHGVIDEATERRARWVNTMPKDVVKDVKKRLKKGETWEDIIPEFGWDNKYRKPEAGKGPVNYKELGDELRGKNYEDEAKSWPVYEGPKKKYK